MTRKTLHRVLSVFLAIVVMASASASGLCAVLCNRGFCCPEPIKVVQAKPESCCAAKVKSAVSEAEPHKSKTCCELKAKDPEPGVQTAKAELKDPVNLVAILPDAPLLPDDESVELRQAPSTEYNHSPPRRPQRINSPRAPPIARV